MSCSYDNTWKDDVIKEKEKKGWLLLLEQFDGKRLAFINVFQTEIIKKNVFYIKILWVNHSSIAEEYKEERFRVIEDCANHKTALIDDNIHLKEVKLPELEWRDTVNDQLHPILCEALGRL